MTMDIYVLQAIVQLLQTRLSKTGCCHLGADRLFIQGISGTAGYLYRKLLKGIRSVKKFSVLHKSKHGAG